jgi:hypothetical protein
MGTNDTKHELDVQTSLLTLALITIILFLQYFLFQYWDLGIVIEIISIVSIVYISIYVTTSIMNAR